MEERLQKLISASGLTSRRGAEDWITAGRVTVNGRVAALGDKADLSRDQVLVDGRPLPQEENRQRTYLMLNKPRGYVSTLSDEKGRRTVAQLVSGCGCRVWPVGRLDMDSEGLLLLTDDGELTHRLIHPSHQVEKEYLVWVTGDVDLALPVLSGPMELDGEPLAPDQRRCEPAVHHHPPGKEPPGAANVRPGGADGKAAQAGAGGPGDPGPGPGPRGLAQADGGGARPAALTADEILPDAMNKTAAYFGPNRCFLQRRWNSCKKHLHFSQEHGKIIVSTLLFCFGESLEMMKYESRYSCVDSGKYEHLFQGPKAHCRVYSGVL